MKKKRNKVQIFLRWKFIVLTVVSTIFLFYIIRSFILEAELSLGLQNIPGFSVYSQVINKEPYAPPTSGVLTPRQIHIFLRIAEGLDSLDNNKESVAAVRKELVNVLNRHGMSLGEYRWTRKVVIALVENRKRRIEPASHADSVNVFRVKMVEQRLLDCYPAFAKRMDKEAL